jgi:uncharacterized protein (UPF0297 family)
MPNRVIVVSAVVLSIGAMWMLSASRRPSHVEVFGHVYERLDSPGRAPANPVIGAVISNDWDSTTTTTNDRGEFRLRVRRVAADEFIELTARAGESAGCHRRIGTLETTPVKIVLNDPMQGPGCRPD